MLATIASNHAAIYGRGLFQNWCLAASVCHISLVYLVLVLVELVVRPVVSVEVGREALCTCGEVMCELCVMHCNVLHCLLLSLLESVAVRRSRS